VKKIAFVLSLILLLTGCQTNNERNQDMSDTTEIETNATTTDIVTSGEVTLPPDVEIVMPETPGERFRANVARAGYAMASDCKNDEGY